MHNYRHAQTHCLTSTIVFCISVKTMTLHPPRLGQKVYPMSIFAHTIAYANPKHVVFAVCPACVHLVLFSFFLFSKIPSETVSTLTSSFVCLTVTFAYRHLGEKHTHTHARAHTHTQTNTQRKNQPEHQLLCTPNNSFNVDWMLVTPKKPLRMQSLEYANWFACKLFILSLRRI